MHWENWYGNQRCSPDHVVAPRSEEEVAEAVIAACARGRTVRPAGSGHSNVPLVPTDGTVLDLQRLTGLVAVDAATRQVTVRAGTRIRDLGPMLWEHGLSLTNQGDIDGQQIAGAIATGTHGTGIGLGSLSSALLGARIVRADGTVATVDLSTPDELRAARTSLGALGVLTELTLQVSAAYALVAQLEPCSWDELMVGWRERLRQHRHFLFYWFPSEAAARAWFHHDPPLRADSVLVRTMDPAHPGTPSEDGDRRRGPAFQVFADPSEPDFHELEFMVPIERAEEALGELREMLLSAHPGHALPLEVRFVAADDAFLSPFAGRASCSISVSGVLGEDNATVFADCERVFARYDGRPHWGKWHPYDAAELERLYPDLDRFRKVREELDPGGTFTNPYLGALLDRAREGAAR
ncbi:D-arabinono-1,4-lactone oxidase [Nocardioides caldifontis]|uniref:D-arabinono-1,4-lactone oxidase n=1 Tax=Nocardioides caldifontis TaxID=2588938 RepID=UPI001EF09A4B|nr:D-arabinono-1,4-lactone oxidase [Nocardioides caldifontis]